MTGSALRPGQPLPAFLGPQSGLVIVLFFRGPWCPVCRRQLIRLGERHAEWEGFDTRIIAVSSSPVTTSAADDSIRRLPIEFVHDANGEQISKLGIGHEHPDHGIIAHPVTLIAADGIIQFAHIGTHSRDRPEPEAILLGIRTLAQRRTPV